MDTILIVAYICLLFQFYRGLPEIIAFFRFIKNNQLNTPSQDSNKCKSPFFYIILPVLREQKVLEATLKNFLALNYPKNKFQIIIVTTEKEIAEGQKLNQSTSTIDLTKTLQIKFNQKYNIPIVRHIHYPYKIGVMSHQVNYALKQIASEHPDNLQKQYMALYNADSWLPTETLNDVCRNVHCAQDSNTVFQQLAFYIKNFQELENLGFIKSNVCKAAGLYQSLYTICQEIPLINRYYYSKRKNRIAYCVGHGMIVRMDLLKSLNWLPTETINEDLPFGFMLCAKKIPIKVIAEFELAETPNSFSSLINQKKVWFWGYLGYPQIFRSVVKTYKINRIDAYYLLFQGIWKGFSWYFISFAYLIPLIIGLVISDWWILSICLIFLVFFQVLPTLIFLSFINHNYGKNSQYEVGTHQVSDYFLLPFFEILILFSDSIGPWLASIQYVIKYLFNIAPEKKKTER